MCISIQNLQGVKISDEQLSNCWENNSDGAGLVWIENWKLKVHKELTDKQAFIDKYNEVYTKSNMLVHFRTTSGTENSEANTHPYLISESMAMIHNGTLPRSSYSNDDPRLSDTYHYVEQVLKPMARNSSNNYQGEFYHPVTSLEDPTELQVLNARLIDMTIGQSKMNFMNVMGKFTIIGSGKADAHYAESGNWFSNNSYKQVNDYKYVGMTKVPKRQSSSYRSWQTLPTRYSTIEHMSDDELEAYYEL